MNVVDNKGVSDVLLEHGVDLASINSIIWRSASKHLSFLHIHSIPIIFSQSRPHRPHRESRHLPPFHLPNSRPRLPELPSPRLSHKPLFPHPRNRLQVHSHPQKPFSLFLTTSSLPYSGRTIREIDFSTESNGLVLGRYRALDFFQDGSFYLLDVPGHAAGHMAALVRTTSSHSTSTFMLLGADTCHHAGEFRPTAYHPLPSHIPGYIHPTGSASSSPCPCTFFSSIHPTQSRTEPYYTIAVTSTGESLALDIPQALESITKLTEFDGNPEIFTVIAHDLSLIGVVDLFPARANAWKEMGWAEKGRWEFLREFKTGLDGDGREF